MFFQRLVLAIAVLVYNSLPGNLSEALSCTLTDCIECVTHPDCYGVYSNETFECMSLWGDGTRNRKAQPVFNTNCCKSNGTASEACGEMNDEGLEMDLKLLWSLGAGVVATIVGAMVICCMYYLLCKLCARCDREGHQKREVLDPSESDKDRDNQSFGEITVTRAESLHPYVQQWLNELHVNGEETESLNMETATRIGMRNSTLSEMETSV